ncbi:MAG: hypothetical protein ABIP48_04570 [Planctomycetota bacterium]
MRRVYFGFVLALAVFTTGAVANYPSSPGTPPAPITTRQTLFSIPFQIDRAQNPGQAPAEVQLHVSTDQGASWRMYAGVRPEQGRFLFRAVTDGEYWFAIRTLGRSGQLRPERADEPGLRVTVDTTLPSLELQARRGEAGQIIVNWKVTEPYLDPGGLKIQYRSDAGRPWQSVAIDPGSVHTSGPTQTGEVLWWPDLRSQVVEIRAEVADRAGNAAVSHAQVDLDRVASADSTPSAEAGRPVEPSAYGPAQAPALPWRASTNSSPSTRAPESSVAVDINPAVGNQYLAARPTAGHSPGSSAPATTRPQMVKSRLFELEYQVDSVESSGLGRVELWGTRDGGRTWTSFGADNDRQSPMLVTVNEEGIYGFRFAVQGAYGAAAQKPQSGDQPDIWIGVDLTKPSARILSAKRGTGNQAGQLVIEWEADDQMLAAHPISLSYSESPGGPWLPIARGLENTGRHAWSVDRPLPERFHLRLEIVDEAGNVGSFETPEAVSSASGRPTVHIHNVRPVSYSVRAPWRPQRFR